MLDVLTADEDLLSSLILIHGDCFAQSQQQVRLAWVDMAGAEIQEDEQHHIKQVSSCAITLTVTFPGKMRFRCRATVGEQVQTSEELYVRVPGPKRGGRGFIIEAETEKQGGNQDTVGLTVGVVGCAVLSALVAVFVVKKRRTSRQLPKESCNMTTSNNDVNADDVVYAEILLPVASGRVLIQDSEPTEYAYVQNK
uniref:uncharacterized protein isoform X3 n=1 Tax=Semicossyphus pulcher TaxID=241346 RepID=UPI0037E91D70